MLDQYYFLLLLDEINVIWFMLVDEVKCLEVVYQVGWGGCFFFL